MSAIDEISNVLAKTLEGSVLHPGNEAYETANSSYFSAFENEIKPSHIVQPSSVKQLQQLIKVLHPYLVAEQCQIAIRGSGHTPSAGSANIQGGVTIDTRSLRGITLSDDQSFVQVAAGETWPSVYAELDKHGFTVAGGRVGRVGVVGLLLGGGLSMFSGRTGFACDSVLEFEVVLASGEVIRASSTEKSDLWVALRGGLNNFGIVTSVKMRTFQATRIWGGLTYYTSDVFPHLMRSACDFAQNEEDRDTHIMASAGYGYGHHVVTCVMYHTQGQENPPSLRRFTTLEPQITEVCSMRTSSHTEFCEELSKFTVDGLRQFWASITIKPDIDLIEAFHQRWQETLSKIKDAEGFTFSLGFQPLTQTLLEASMEAGGNAMNIAPSDGPLFIVLINPVWSLAQDDERITTELDDLIKDLKQLAQEKKLLHRYIFTNYGYSKHDVMAGYGQESLSRLKEVSRKYDPDGIFQNAVPGGFKLQN